MKKPAVKYYDAIREDTPYGRIFNCKCWICGAINRVEYRWSPYGILWYYPEGLLLCRHSPGWNHDAGFTWVKMAFKEPPKPHKKRSSR
jgi:hypothetical protein